MDKYAIQDVKRLEDAASGYWWFLTAQATVYGEDENEIGSAALVGIESDRGDDALESALTDVIYEALADAGCEK